MASRLIDYLNPRQFANYMKENYRYFEVYKGSVWLGRCKHIFGYYAYVEELGEKRRIIDVAQGYKGTAVLYVK